MAEIVSVQNRYSVLDRAATTCSRACEQRGIAYIPWFPLAAGRAGGEHRVRSTRVAARARRDHRPDRAGVAARALARDLPIPGTSQIAHLEENLAAAELTLSAAELRELDRAATAAPPGR